MRQRSRKEEKIREKGKKAAFIQQLCSAVTIISHTLSPVNLTPTLHGQQYFRDEENFELNPKSVDA